MQIAHKATHDPWTKVTKRWSIAGTELMCVAHARLSACLRIRDVRALPHRVHLHIQIE